MIENPFRKKLSLLIVAGDEPVRELLATVAAQTARFEHIHLMADGRFALEKIWEWVERRTDGVPDVIILDLWLPGLNAIQFIRELRRYEEMRSAYVAVFASSGGYAEQDRTETAGCDYFIRRPESPETVGALLHAIADRRITQATNDAFRIEPDVRLRSVVTLPPDVLIAERGRNV